MNAVAMLGRWTLDNVQRWGRQTMFLLNTLAGITSAVPPLGRTPPDARAMTRCAAPCPASPSPAAGGAVPHPDLELFLAAEAVRDEMDAPKLAAAVFQAVQHRFPHSAIAPKALLASAALTSSAR